MTKMNSKKFKVHIIAEFTGDTLDDVDKKIKSMQFLPEITKVEVEYRRKTLD
jgi:hypothetical protein